MADVEPQIAAGIERGVVEFGMLVVEDEISRCRDGECVAHPVALDAQVGRQPEADVALARAPGLADIVGIDPADADGRIDAERTGSQTEGRVAILCGVATRPGTGFHRRFGSYRQTRFAAPAERRQHCCRWQDRPVTGSCRRYRFETACWRWDRPRPGAGRSVAAEPPGRRPRPRARPGRSAQQAGLHISSSRAMSSFPASATPQRGAVGPRSRQGLEATGAMVNGWSTTCARLVTGTCNIGTNASMNPHAEGSPRAMQAVMSDHAQQGRHAYRQRVQSHRIGAADPQHRARRAGKAGIRARFGAGRGFCRRRRGDRQGERTHHSVGRRQERSYRPQDRGNARLDRHAGDVRACHRGEPWRPRHDHPGRCHHCSVELGRDGGTARCSGLFPPFCRHHHRRDGGREKHAGQDRRHRSACCRASKRPAP